jgi:thioredoxin reductase (NADPH)
MYDIIVVGAGPMGIAVGIEAQKHKLRCLLVEKGALVNSIYHFPVNMTFFSTSERLEIGEVPFISHGDKPTRTEALEYFRRVIDRWKLNISNYEEVLDIQKQNGAFQVHTTRGSHMAKNVIVATGFYGLPNLMRVPGEELSKVKHYYSEPHPYIGKRVVVVGAANSACDVALELFYKQAEVTMVIRGSELSERVKYWIKPNIENRIKEGSIKAYFNTQIERIQEDSIRLQTPDGEQEIANDFVLAMTGFSPDYTFLNKVGVRCLKDQYASPEYNPETHETHVPGLYLAGVVCGGLKTNKYFIENSKDHAEKIVAKILKDREFKG